MGEKEEEDEDDGWKEEVSRAKGEERERRGCERGEGNSRQGERVPHLEETCEEQREVLHKGLFVVRAVLVGGGDVGARGEDVRELPHDDIEDVHEVLLILGRQLQGADLGRG